jgi:PPM family protein phosphatase
MSSVPQNPNTAPDNAPADIGAAVPALRISCGYATDRGLRRELNEDAFLAMDPIFAVADGMGGHEAGEVASRECISTLSTTPALASGTRHASAVELQEALQLADLRIRQRTDSRAGTTVSGVVLVEERQVPYWLVFNVGDSRTYRLSQGTFEQVSVDHSEVQEMVDAGYISAREALVHPRRNVVTRALGTGTDAEADYWMMPVEDGDRFIVCSDGLTGEVSDQHLEDVLRSVPDPQQAVDHLVQAALRSGGRDNITVLIIDASTSAAGASGHPGDSRDTLPRGIVVGGSAADPPAPGTASA